MGKALGFLLVIAAVLCGIGLIIMAVCFGWGFNMGCEQYLKRASDANTVENALIFWGVMVLIVLAIVGALIMMVCED